MKTLPAPMTMIDPWVVIGILLVVGVFMLGYVLD
jgi:hypothetical protein